MFIEFAAGDGSAGIAALMFHRDAVRKHTNAAGFGGRVSCTRINGKDDPRAAIVGKRRLTPRLLLGDEQKQLARRAKRHGAPCPSKDTGLAVRAMTGLAALVRLATLNPNLLAGLRCVTR